MVKHATQAAAEAKEAATNANLPENMVQMAQAFAIGRITGDNDFIER